MNILFLTTVIPERPKTGGEVASLQVINALRGLGHTVKVFGYGRPGEKCAAIAPDDIVVETRYIESSSSRGQALLSLCTAFATHRPYSCSKYMSQKYVNRVAAELENKSYDVAIIEHAQMAWLLPYLSAGKTSLPVIFLAQNVEYDLYQELYRNTSFLRPLQKYLYFRESRLMHDIENDLFRGVSQIWVFNGTDKGKIENEFHTRAVHAIHVPAGFGRLLQEEKKYSVAALGTWTWDANSHGLRWFVDRVMPLLNPNIDVHVAGIGADWVNGRYSNLYYHGFVDDAQSFLSSAECIIVPSTSGGGIQIKTLEAISTGVPVVSTSTGMRGIEPFPPSVSVADDPVEFARGIESIVSDQSRFDAQDGYWWSLQRKEAFDKTIRGLIEGVIAK